VGVTVGAGGGGAAQAVSIAMRRNSVMARRGNFIIPVRITEGSGTVKRSQQNKKWHTWSMLYYPA